MSKKPQDGVIAPPQCFVIMPISDIDPYRPGHFAEVYSELIKPAVEEAGYRCTRADDVAASNLIHLDVVTRIVKADLCICDLSTRNPNVMFEYGLRQAFDRPTVLIKDNITPRIFDLSGFRDIEYDSTLRIKNILSTKATLVGAIKETIDSAGVDGNVFSLVKLMGLAQAATIPESNVDKDTAQFKILSKQIEELQAFIRSMPLAGKIDRPIMPPLRARDITTTRALKKLFDHKDITLYSMEPFGVRAASSDGKIMFSFETEEEFERSPLMKSLSERERQVVMANLMPF